MTLKYDDCASCAFQEDSNMVCDKCIGADQWEEMVDENSVVFANYSTKPIAFRTSYRRKSKESKPHD